MTISNIKQLTDQSFKKKDCHHDQKHSTIRLNQPHSMIIRVEHKPTHTHTHTQEINTLIKYY